MKISCHNPGLIYALAEFISTGRISLSELRPQTRHLGVITRNVSRTESWDTVDTFPLGLKHWPIWPLYFFGHMDSGAQHPKQASHSSHSSQFFPRIGSSCQDGRTKTWVKCQTKTTIQIHPGYLNPSSQHGRKAASTQGRGQEIHGDLFKENFGGCHREWFPKVTIRKAWILVDKFGLVLTFLVKI